MKTDAEKKRYPGFEHRIWLLGAAILAALTVLLIRLWQLQIVEGAEYLAKSNSNRLRIQRLEAPRGVIYGSDGPDNRVVLADNRPARDIVFVPAECEEDPAVVCARLETLLGIDGGELLGRIDRLNRLGQPHTQITVKADVSGSVLARIEEYSFALSGVITVTRPVRRYLYGETAGQLLGYMGEINDAELERQETAPAYSSYSPYQMGDWIGRAGLEARYERLLRGRDGQMLVTRFAAGEPQLRTDPYGNLYVQSIVDSHGHALHLEDAIQHPDQGQPLFVTLDIGLQSRVESLLEGEEGAIVVLDADTGAILAMASAPGYDPSIFVNEHRVRERSEALHGTPNRMQHRAFSEHFAPGSVFKVLLAAAALEERAITEQTSFHCPGRFRLKPGGRAWHCWKRAGHGDVTVVEALAFSCDVFFYNVGLALGVDKIHSWAKRVGLGVKTGIDLPGEIPGLIPSREWQIELLKKRLPDEPWNQNWWPGDTVNLSIGQGACATTPLQNAVMMASIVNGGFRVRPFLNRRALMEQSDKLFHDKTLQIVRRGLKMAVEKGPPAPTGTGNQAYVEGIGLIGKTGTAQVVGLEHHAEYETEEEIPKEQRDHAWFIAGVFDREPRIAICILIEHGHHGSSAAAPLAADIVKYVYLRDSETLLAQQGTEAQ